MSLIARVDEATGVIVQLERCLNNAKVLERYGCGESPEEITECAPLKDFVQDAKRFLLHARGGIQASPLQVYSSGLVFAPETSLVRRHFVAQLPGWVSLHGSRKMNWDACLLVLESHYKAVRAVVFSPDGQTLASASDDSTVRLWASNTEQSRHTLVGYTRIVIAVVFSPDGQTLVLTSEDTTVRL